MNHRSWKKILVNSPEAAEKVDTRLHQDIMRAVRLAQPSGRSPLFKRAAPAWGAGVFAAMLIGVFFYMPRMKPVMPSPAPVPVASKFESSPAPIMILEERLQAFTRNTGASEQELRKELERLKSDIARFDFRS